LRFVLGVAEQQDQRGHDDDAAADAEHAARHARDHAEQDQTQSNHDLILMGNTPGMRIGLWGAGGIAKVHARHAARLPGVSLVVYDRDPQRASELAGTHGGATAESDADLMGQADAIVICLPTDLHAVAAETALRASRPVLVEKPMVRHLAEADFLVDLSRQTGTPLVPAHVVRFFADYEAMHQQIKRGAVGQIATARIRRGGKAPLGSDAWFRNPERSGGVLLDLAVHDFDWLLWTLGPVTRVDSRSRWLGGGSTETGDFALTTLTFASGALAHVESTWMDPSGFSVSVEVAGSDGVVAYDSRATAGLRTHTEAGSTAATPRADADDPYFRQMKAFVAAARGETPPAVTAEEGRDALAVALAAVQSATERRPVSLSARIIAGLS